MIKKILITSPSFIDTPGKHQLLLEESGFEILHIRGHHKEAALLQIIDTFPKIDGILCGEDELKSTVLQRLSPALKVISKYGVSLDSIDRTEAKKLGIQILSTQRLNHTTVSEHTFGLIFSLLRNIPKLNSEIHALNWNRIPGRELAGKTMAIFGFGKVGKEVAKRALAFGTNVVAYNSSWSQENLSYMQELESFFNHPLYADTPVKITRNTNPEEILATSDIISIHMNLNKENSNFFDKKKISSIKKGAILINVSRGGLVDHQAVADEIKNGKIAGFGADVLDEEPMTENHPLRHLENVIITPHIASRTYESVARTGLAAAQNIIQFFNP